MLKPPAFRKRRILLLSAYDAGSHRRWRELLVHSQPDFEWHVLSLSPRFFRWRIRGNALTWLNEPLLKESWDLLLVTSMVDLASIRGFHPNLAATPALLYMHENQFAYPASDDQHSSVDPQVVNLFSAIAANAVVFNSDWNRRSCLDGIEKLFRRLPDGIPEGTLARLAEKSCVLPVPIDDHAFINEAEVGPECPEVGERLWGNDQKIRPCSSPLRIVWAARWEYDKGPDRLLAILQELDRRAVNFQVCILGESFRKVPEALVTIREQFSHRLVQFGYAPNRAQYYEWLGSADIILSTALHEFQGLAVLEAVAAGCVPIAPEREVYPELFAPEYLYPDCGDDISAEAVYAAALIENQAADSGQERLPVPGVQRFSRDALVPGYKALLSKTIAGSA
ncbi:tRNA-queuosine alpha-mannosyltransferase domain-containing protein [Marinobacter sp.]|uniref:tRNA-queuosine alpha-mannosyltransferase domain-containing protein n=1 Tax=Marinobacter sp. TaxID=50741 RepID=UPI003A8E18FF